LFPSFRLKERKERVSEMGTDIHLFVEKKNKETNRWELIEGENPRISFYQRWLDDIQSGKRTDVHNIDYCQEELKELEGSPLVTEGWVYDGRNYDLFGMLADVRNGRGFAGIKTGEGFKPISLPKGLPDDLSEELENDRDSIEDFYHSHSYLTVEELLAYDWEQKTTHCGYVTPSEYLNFKKQGYPTRWTGGLNETSIVSHEEMENYIKENPSLVDQSSILTQVTWQEPYKEAASIFYNESLNKLKELVEDSPQDVRMVFWFDS